VERTIIGGKSEMPNRHLVSDEDQNGENSLEHGKGSHQRKDLKPGLDVKQVDVKGEKKDRQYRKPENQRMIVLRRGSGLPFRFSEVTEEALKSPPAVGGKDPPGGDQHDHRVPKGIFGSASLLADAQDEENNDEVEDVVKHARVLQGNSLCSPHGEHRDVFAYREIPIGEKSSTERQNDFYLCYLTLKILSFFSVSSVSLW